MVSQRTAAYRSVVILTGAGISAESGIRTFRAADGLWEQHRVEDVASPEGFARDPDLVYRFYNQRRQQLLDPKIQPNAAHQALARLEQAFAGEVSIITQNIDDLHERAGSRNVVHMHGELLKVRCIRSMRVYAAREPVDARHTCTCCRPPSKLRPHVVWFGEIPLAMGHISRLLQQCDLFLAIGTSGHVYPAAGFVQEAKASGAHALEMNLAPSHVQSFFDEHVYGLATQTVPAWVETLL